MCGASLSGYPKNAGEVVFFSAFAMPKTVLRYLLIDDEKKIAACVDPAEVNMFRSEVSGIVCHAASCRMKAHIVLAKAKEEKVEIVAVSS